MNCPDCKETLVMSDRNGVEIDYCPKCRGVWLDRGELDKIIEREQSSFPGGQGNHKGGHHHEDDHKYRKNKKDSFFGDLFDF